MRIDLLLLGYRTFALPLEAATSLFDWWRERGFTPKVLIRDEKKGELRFSCTLPAARRYLIDPPPQLAVIREIQKGGLPFLFQTLSHRPGLLLGLILSVLLILVSNLFVWDVRIETEGELTSKELRDELAAAGLRVGSFLPSVDKDGVVTALRMGDSRVAYATVNLSGTVAYVQVRQGQEKGEEKKATPANLVARCDATVTMPLIFSGQCVVKEGDVVRAGQILASGVIDTDNNGFRVTRAAGQVLARTTKTYTVTVPFAYKEKVYTGENDMEASLLFFENKLKVLKKSSKVEGECDIIEKTAWWSIGGVTLPLGVTSYQLLTYELCDATRTAQQAYTMALQELTETLAADSVGRTMLSRTVETVVGDEGITLICTVVCEEDIATTVEITS